MQVASGSTYYRISRQKINGKAIGQKAAIQYVNLSEKSTLSKKQQNNLPTTTPLSQKVLISKIKLSREIVFEMFMIK